LFWGEGKIADQDDTKTGRLLRLKQNHSLLIKSIIISVREKVRGRTRLATRRAGGGESGRRGTKENNGPFSKGRR